MKKKAGSSETVISLPDYTVSHPRRQYYSILHNQTRRHVVSQFLIRLTFNEIQYIYASLIFDYPCNNKFICYIKYAYGINRCTCYRSETKNTLAMSITQNTFSTYDGSIGTCLIWRNFQHCRPHYTN